MGLPRKSTRTSPAYTILRLKLSPYEDGAQFYRQLIKVTRSGVHGKKLESSVASNFTTQGKAICIEWGYPELMEATGKILYAVHKHRSHDGFDPTDFVSVILWIARNAKPELRALIAQHSMTTFYLPSETTIKVNKLSKNQQTAAAAADTVSAKKKSVKKGPTSAQFRVSQYSFPLFHGSFELLGELA